MPNIDYTKMANPSLSPVNTANASNATPVDDGNHVKKPVVTGQQYKKPEKVGFGTKLYYGIFGNDGAKGIGTKIYENVIKPNTQRVAMEIVSSSISMIGDVIIGAVGEMLHVDPKYIKKTFSSSSGYNNPYARITKTSYDLISTGLATSAANNAGPKTNTTNQNTSGTLQGIKYHQRSDACTVIEELETIIKQFGFSTVADLYNLSGITITDWTTYKMGWTSVAGYTIVNEYGDWVLYMPEPKKVKN